MDNKIYIIPIPNGSPVKIISEQYSCPLDPSCSCKYAEFKADDGLNVEITCKQRKCDEFDKNEIIKQVLDSVRATNINHIES